MVDSPTDTYSCGKHRMTTAKAGAVEANIKNMPKASRRAKSGSELQPFEHAPAVTTRLSAGVSLAAATQAQPVYSGETYDVQPAKQGL